MSVLADMQADVFSRRDQKDQSFLTKFEFSLRSFQYLDAQIQKYINKSDKTDEEVEREQSLVDQWVCLTEERNSVMVPAAGSGVPGAPADWDPPDGTEAHCPVLFLDLNADDLSTGYAETGETPVFGANSILPKEHGGKFFNLPVLRYLDGESGVGVVATWDSSIHDSLCLNRVTPGMCLNGRPDIHFLLQIGRLVHIPPSNCVVQLEQITLIFQPTSGPT